MHGLAKHFFLASALVLGACATTPGTEVTRFHLGQPIPSDAIQLVPAPGMTAQGADPGMAAQGLEFRSHAAAVAADLNAIGLRPAENDGQSAYIGVLTVEQTSYAGAPRQSPFSIGIGGFGGSFGGGGGVGVGGGVTMPIGKAPSNEVRVNMLSLQIRRRSDNHMLWEGRAVQQIAADAPASALPAAVPALSRALLTGFPGANGQTVIVKARQ